MRKVLLSQDIPELSNLYAQKLKIIEDNSVKAKRQEEIIKEAQAIQKELELAATDLAAVKSRITEITFGQNIELLDSEIIEQYEEKDGEKYFTVIDLGEEARENGIKIAMEMKANKGKPAEEVANQKIQA